MSDSNKKTECEKAVVVDMDSATKPGDIFTVVADFVGDDALAKAVSWVDNQDSEDVMRGRYGIDVNDEK